MVSPALASVLASGRADFNARFATAHRAQPELDANDFRAFVVSSLDPLIAAVAEVAPDRVGPVAFAAYDAALALLAARLAGPCARTPAVDFGWRTAFPPAAHLIAAAPNRLIAALSNAFCQIAATPGARADQFASELARLAPHVPDPATLLSVGQVCAWRAGLAHYRRGAHDVAASLPEALALLALGADANANANANESRDQVLSALRSDPWHIPGTPAPRLSVAATVGAFRGLGGLFIEPPRVARASDGWLVSSGCEAFYLLADAHGATFHRATDDEIAAAKAAPPTIPGLAIRGRRVQWGEDRLDLPISGEITSVVAEERTLAITASHAHSIVFVRIGKER